MAVVNTLIGHIKGPKGDTGETGATGATGAAGADATVSVGSTTTVPYGQAARVTNTGTPGAAVFNFTIPQGKPGEQTTKLDALTLDALTEPSTAFPVPAVGDNGSTLFGKISKWFSDMSALVATKLNVANVVNNQTTTASGYALDARQANPNVSGSLAEWVNGLMVRFTGASLSTIYNTIANSKSRGALVDLDGQTTSTLTNGETNGVGTGHALFVSAGYVEVLFYTNVDGYLWMTRITSSGTIQTKRRVAMTNY